jgi:hypothetical protein
MAGVSFLGFSATIASVVMSNPAIEAAAARCGRLWSGLWPTG